MKKAKKAKVNNTELINIEKLRELGITKDPNKSGIEEFDGDKITGGRNDGGDPTVVGQWPTGLNLININNTILITDYNGILQ
jgi:hypothetical protein